MAFNPNGITKQHVLDAVDKIESEKIPLIKSTRWLVEIINMTYPPKDIMRYAHEQMNGEHMWEYGGGHMTNKYLANMGFEIIDMHQKNDIQSLIDDYKKQIKKTHLKDERYKWELLSAYNGRPNLEAENLLEELKSIDYNNLLYAMSKAVIKHLTIEKPEEVRSLFKMLFDESIDLNTRVKSFNKDTLAIYRGLGETLQHHQDERTISTYLTFKNPNKHTFYKHSFYKALCELLNIKQAKKNEKYAHYLNLVDEIIEDYIEQDAELIQLVKDYIPKYYDGSNNLLLVQDILYQMLDKNEPVNYWVYAPGENASKWEEFYEKGVMGLGWDSLGDLNDYPTKKSIKKKLQELENVTSTKQNDTAANYEFLKVIKPDDVIIVKKGISELLGYGVVTSDYFYDAERSSYQKCRSVDWQLKGNWKLDFNLPLKTLTNVTKYKEADNTNYYDKLLSIMKGELDLNHNTPLQYNCPLNQIFYGPPGTGKTYSTILEAAKIVTQNEDLSYDEAQAIFNDNLGNQIEFITFHQNYSYEDFVQGLRPDVNQKELSFNRADGVFTKMVTKALFEYYKVYQQTQKNQLNETATKIDLNDAFIEFMNSLEKGQEFETKTGSKIKVDNFTDRQNIEFKPINGIKTYLVSGNRLLKLYETYNDITKIKRVHEDIVNAIGGCNATIYYVALREFIDFLKVYEATLTEFDDEEEGIGYENVTYNRKKELLSTISLDDIRTVSEHKVSKYVIIIDEINRANISRVFGELITLIEKDKRSHGKIPLKATLPSGEPFVVPSNLYIIGTMNTADKSIALLDIALRRRFEFVPMYPNSESTEDKVVHNGGILEAINKEIVSRKGYDFTIGHSYFMGVDYDLKNTIDNKVIPLLLEYFMNDFEEVKKILNSANISVDGWPMQYLAND